MKKIFTKFLSLTAILFFVSTNLTAQTYNGGTWYSLYDEEEHSNVVVYTDFAEKSLFTPVESITFDYKKYSLISINGKVEVQNLVDGKWQKKGDASYSDYKNYKTSSTISLDANATKIRYYLASGSGVYVKNHFAKLAKHILLADGGFGKTTDSKSFGSVTIDGQSAAQKVTLRSFLTAGNVTVTSSDNAFRINSANNLSGLTYAVGANACASANGQSGAQAGGATLGDINQYAFDIYFCPTEAKEYSATITITDGTSTATIAVSGEGLRKNQRLTWSDMFKKEEVSLPLGKKVTDAATATSGLAITYSTDNESVIQILDDGAAFKAIAVGSAKIYATQAGDNRWNSVSDSVQVSVTEKIIQYIHWTDNLTRIKLGEVDSIPLTATASILLNAETGETQDAPERTALITYQSADNNVVTIDGTTLIIVGEGTTTVTASLPGDDIYEQATISMPVRVRVPSATCEAYVLEATEEFSQEYSLVGQTRIYEPAAFTGPGHILTFEARKQRGEAVGNIQIQQYVNGEWKDIDDANPGTDWRDYWYELDRNATKIRFYNGYGSYKRYFKNVLVTQATYLETTTPAVTVEQSIIGDEITKNIAVQYSNLFEGVTVTNVSDNVTLSTSELATGCGKYGEEIVTLTIRPTEIGTIYDTVTIHDEATGLTLNIPVTVHTQRKTQTILWEDSIETIYATDEITLTATAVNPIHYTSSDSAIAYVDDTNKLIINAIGNVTITAHAAESETYNPAELSKNITILHAVPVILSLPSVEPVGYGVALTDDMLVGGEVNVEGAFVWNTDPEQKLVPGEYNLPIQFIPTSPIFGVIDTTVVVTVLKGKQSIVWEQDFSDVYVTDTLYLYATALTELYYENTDWDMADLDENQLTFYKAGELRVDAIAKEDDFYYGDTLSVVITVKPEEIESLVTTYPTATSIVYGQLLGESSLEGGAAAVEGEFMWADDNLELPAGTHWMPAQFVPEAADLYAPVEFMVEVLVERAPQTIDWTVGELVTIELGDTLELTATASSELPVSYMLDAEGVVTIEDNYLIAVGVGNVNVIATQDGEDEYGDANYLPAEPVTYTITVVEKNVNTSLESVEANANAARKIVRNGQLFIIRGEHTYNALGSLIR